MHPYQGSVGVVLRLWVSCSTMCGIYNAQPSRGDQSVMLLLSLEHPASSVRTTSADKLTDVDNCEFLGRLPDGESISIGEASTTEELV